MQQFRILFYHAKGKGDAPPVWNPLKLSLSKGLVNSRKALSSMDASTNFREGMRKAFVQVCLVPFSGDVVEQPDEVYIRRWVGSDPGAMLSARAS
eukprot:2453695-Rhodomonas_salina.1